jgi:Zn-dependent M28 family amino/carboxypeptidase
MLIATIGNLALRMAWVSYSEVEAAMRFTPAMMTARLILGALSALGAGRVVAWVTRRNRRALFALVGILVVLFIPVHHALWATFPIWYHVIFFASLVVMTPVGAMLDRYNASRGSGGIG